MGTGMLNKVLIWLGIIAILTVIALNIFQRGIAPTPKVAALYEICSTGR